MKKKLVKKLTFLFATLAVVVNIAYAIPLTPVPTPEDTSTSISTMDFLLEHNN